MLVDGRVDNAGAEPKILVDQISTEFSQVVSAEPPRYRPPQMDEFFAAEFEDTTDEPLPPVAAPRADKTAERSPAAPAAPAGTPTAAPTAPEGSMPDAWELEPPPNFYDDDWLTGETPAATAAKPAAEPAPIMPKPAQDPR